MTIDEILMTTRMMRHTPIALDDRLALLVTDEEWNDARAYCNALALWPQHRGEEPIRKFYLHGVRILRKKDVDGL